PLPEAQLDRFLLRVIVGYPSAADERALLDLERRGLEPTAADSIRPLVDADSVTAARLEVDATLVRPEIADYVAAIVRATRAVPSVEVGASPRAGVHLLVVAKAIARLNG